MKFNVMGNEENPVVVMLTGSFCPGECLEYIYSRMENYYVVVPTYNGHYEGAKDFTTREGEAKEIREYLSKLHIDHIHMIYGQSMGSEIGMELYRQLLNAGIKVDHMFFDGAPMIRLSPIYKRFMRFKFRTMIRMFRDKTMDEAMNMRFLKQFAGRRIKSLKPMIESLVVVAPYLSVNSIKNEVECCYTFDFPELDDEMQKNTYFFYGDEEKAYQTCYNLVQKAYPNANYRVEKGHGHMTYSCEEPDKYVQWLQDIIVSTN
nr:alpha/beta hydrolase [Eubacterium sp.]